MVSGATLYELLAGQAPYSGADAAAVLRQVIHGPPPRISERNPQAAKPLCTIAETAMSRELRDRYASMSDVLADLERAKLGAAPWGASQRAPTRDRGKVVVAGISVLIICALFALGLRKRIARDGGNLAVSLAAEDTRGLPSDQADVTAIEFESFRVTRFHGSTRRVIGVLGESADSAVENDSLRCIVRLHTTAHCLLLAINPDASVQRCYPTTLAVETAATDQIVFPDNVNAGYQLTDGPGVQAFLCLAAHDQSSRRGITSRASRLG